MSFQDTRSRYETATALTRLDPEVLKLKGVVDPATARRHFAELDGAIVHAMPTGEANSFAMMGFTYDPTFTVVPLELVTPEGRFELDLRRGLRPSTVYFGLAEVVPQKPLRNIRDAYDLARLWIDVAICGKPGFIG